MSGPRRAAATPRALHVLDEVESTQSVLAGLAAGGAPEGTVVTARHQTGGRGRRGRGWWDRPGESLLLSLLLRPGIHASHAAQLSLVGALAVTDALGTAAQVDARIRWPNDVLAGGRKIGGILPEGAAGCDGRLGHVILGIGINVDQAAFPDELAERATSLRLLTGRSHDPARLLEPVLDALERRYEEWRGHGFLRLRTAWRERAFTLGRPVVMPDGTIGVAVDIAEDGALLVRAADGRLERVVSGEVETVAGALAGRG